LKNNYISDNKQIGLIDYSNNGFIRSSQTSLQNKPLIPPSVKTGFLQGGGDIKKSSSTPIINQGSILSKSTTIKQGPIKIQEDKNDYYNNNISTIKKNVYQNNYTPKQYTSNSQQSTQMKTTQKPKENVYERPSTAPSKNDIKSSTSTMSSNPISNSNSLKRLPSPNVKSNNTLNDNNNKNPLYSSAKYRSPSPANLMTKPSFGMSSFKGVSSTSKKMK